MFSNEEVAEVLQYLAENPDGISSARTWQLSNMVEELRKLLDNRPIPLPAVAEVFRGPGDGDFETDTFDVILAAVGNNRIHVIKALREVLDITLQESKDMTESDVFEGGYGPGIKCGVSLEEANEIRAKLSEAGATVVITQHSGLEMNEADAFDVVLVDVGCNKIQVIKTIRELTGLGLKDSKEMTEGFTYHAHWTIKQLCEKGRFVARGLSKFNAEMFRLSMAEAGAKVILMNGRGQRWLRLKT